MEAFFGLTLLGCGFVFAWMAKAADLRQRGKTLFYRHVVAGFFASVIEILLAALIAYGDASWWRWALATIIVISLFLNRSPQPKSSDDTLQRVCQRMTADGSLDVEEISDLQLYVKTHPAEVKAGLPAKLAAALDEAWADGSISTQEAFALYDIAAAIGKGMADLPPPKPSRKPEIVTAVDGVSIILCHGEPVRPRKVRSKGAIDTIRFDYEDAYGAKTSRLLSVYGVTDEYMEGMCHTRNAVRTFRLDRIAGQITSVETGEVLEPYRWASSILGAEITSPSDLGVIIDDDDLYCSEVLITGFPAAERAKLERRALDANMVVRKTVTKNLAYLVAGPKAGLAKLAQAKERNAVVIDADKFIEMVGQ